MTTNRLRRPLAVAIGFLAVIGVVASATFFSRPHINPGFLDYPTIVALHVILGGLYVAFAPFQLVRRIRRRWPGYHRWAGRLLVVTGLAAGVCALFMAWVIPFAGWWSRIILGFFGILFCLALVRAYLYIRAGRVALHREWMIRAFALGLAPALDRLIVVPAVTVLVIANDIADPTPAQVAPIAVVSFTLAFTLNAMVAEVWIRATRRRGAHLSEGTGRELDPGTRRSGASARDTVRGERGPGAAPPRPSSAADRGG
jgi:uncharacterized membrane protein